MNIRKGYKTVKKAVKCVFKYKEKILAETENLRDENSILFTGIV